MAASAITVENLGKRYIIGHQSRTRGSYVALRDVISDAGRNFGRRLLHPLQHHDFHPDRLFERLGPFRALRDLRRRLVATRTPSRASLLPVLVPLAACIPPINHEGRP